MAKRVEFGMRRILVSAVALMVLSGCSGWVLALEAGEWHRIEPRPGSGDDSDGPVSRGESIAAIGESMFVYGGVRWPDWDDSEPKWLDEAWLWRP